MVICEQKTTFFSITGQETDKERAGEVSVSYAARYLYLGACITDNAKVDNTRIHNILPTVAVVNTFSIFCAVNTQTPFIYMKSVRNNSNISAPIQF